MLPLYRLIPIALVGSALSLLLIRSEPAAQEPPPPEPPPGLSALPELVEQPEAAHPQAALDDGVWADVLLRIEIGADGRVSSAAPAELVLYYEDDDGSLVGEVWPVDEDPYGFVDVAS